MWHRAQSTVFLALIPCEYICKCVCVCVYSLRMQNGCCRTLLLLLLLWEHHVQKITNGISLWNIARSSHGNSSIFYHSSSWLHHPQKLPYFLTFTFFFHFLSLPTSLLLTRSAFIWFRLSKQWAPQTLIQYHKFLVYYMRCVHIYISFSVCAHGKQAETSILFISSN